MDFVINSLKWIILALSIILALKFIGGCALLYGISHRKSSFIKCWLIIEAVEIFLLVLFDSFQLFILGSTNESIATMSLVLSSFLLFFTIKFYFWILIFDVKKYLDTEWEEEKTSNRFIAYDLHHSDIQIEKAKGKYMRF